MTEWTCLNVFMAKLVADTPQKPARAHMARLIAQKMPNVYPAPAVQLAQLVCMSRSHFDFQEQQNTEPHWPVVLLGKTNSVQRSSILGMSLKTAGNFCLWKMH